MTDTNEIFEQSAQEVAEENALMGEDSHEEAAEEQHELNFDHQPTNDDDDEYWRGFAESKGWQDREDKDGDYVGFKAFVRNHDRIESIKNGKGELKDLQRELREVVRGQRDIKEQQEARHKAELDQMKAELEKVRANAKENLDFEAYDKAGDELDKLKAAAAPKIDKPQGEAQVFVDFRSENPELLRDSDVYDSALTSLVENEVNGKVRAFYERYDRLPDEQDIKSYLSDAIVEAKSGLVKYQDQNKPSRKPPATNPATRKGGKVTLDPSKLSSSDRGMYDYYKGQGLDKAAEAFLKDSLGA